MTRGNNPLGTAKNLRSRTPKIDTVPIRPTRIRMPDQTSAELLNALLKAAGAQRTEMLGQILSRGLDTLLVTAYAGSPLRRTGTGYTVGPHSTVALSENPRTVHPDAEVWTEENDNMPAGARETLETWRELLRDEDYDHEKFIVYREEDAEYEEYWSVDVLMPIVCIRSVDGELIPVTELLATPLYFKNQIKLG